jgi:hypothetical protein
MTRNLAISLTQIYNVTITQTIKTTVPPLPPNTHTHTNTHARKLLRQIVENLCETYQTLICVIMNVMAYCNTVRLNTEDEREGETPREHNKS